ncbi:putative enzyme [Agrobacterium tumefaciens str. Kerr 14]|uniref:Putative enzyme n=1 Tax=Agrobacterium tumefaciens str. Kerr 14 TaxID=1183424 RepID=A0A1S7SCT5_AGRTU|nr:type II toxin-antitoxin system VapC family toxin [Agrobacterium tumefaciens]CUX66567.1 putative enzyme [Agrobacterium tumefaciens str. Kerr 14]
MVVDTSVTVAIPRDVPEAISVEKALVSDAVCLVPASCVLEARMVPVSQRGEHALAEIDMRRSKIAADIIPVDADLVDLATQAWLTYGKGRHPASLNFADCFSYALAKRADVPALIICQVFAQIDIASA